MAYRSRKEVEASIRRRVKVVGEKEYEGWEAYLGVDPYKGRPVKLYRGTLAKLRKDIRAFFERVQSGGEAGGSLSVMEAADARAALDALARAGADVSLTEIARFYLGGGVNARGAKVAGAIQAAAHRSECSASVSVNWTFIAFGASFAIFAWLAIMLLSVSVFGVVKKDAGIRP